jgi:CelD/BcsL family acetyltransferase involved in cellulose biosynthesis
VPSIRIHTSAWELEKLRPLWESLYAERRRTVFQNFDWNLLATRQFSDREEPFVVSAEASYGAAIVPAVRRRHDGSLRLLGEELFDYRGFLCRGDEEVLRSALAALAEAGAPLEVLALRECDRQPILEELDLIPFTTAPSVSRSDVSAEEFGARHNRLGRNLRRFQRQGFELKLHCGDDSQLVRSIYQAKAAHDPGSLFHDPARVEFMVEAARILGNRCEIFSLESPTALAAGLVTFRDDQVRRFYTCLFSADHAKLSPALTLIHEVTRESLDAGLDCDYMTGEQGYKLRLATSSVPLYRLRATPERLACLASSEAQAAYAGPEKAA